MTVKEMLKTFGMIMGGLIGFGVFFFISTPFIFILSNHSILFELWLYLPIYFLIVFCGHIIHYAITPQEQQIPHTEAKRELRVSDIVYDEQKKEYSFVVYSTEKINIRMVRSLLDV